MKDETMKCPHCGKQIIAQDLRKSSGDPGDKVLKVRVVFFSDDKKIKGVCGGCRRSIDIPYRLVPEEVGQEGL